MSDHIVGFPHEAAHLQYLQFRNVQLILTKSAFNKKFGFRVCFFSGFSRFGPSHMS